MFLMLKLKDKHNIKAMKGNTITLLVLAAVVFLVFRNSTRTSSNETGTTVGLTPSTNSTIGNIILGLAGIFSGKSSSLTSGENILG
jgi:hypothetical protein